MNHPDILLAALEAADRRRAERRRFLKFAGGAAASAGALSLLSACGGDDDDDGGATPTPTPTPSSTASPTPTPTPSPAFAEVDVLNFALNLEYLEATFYSFAAFGTDLPAALTGGTGSQGAVTGGRAVSFGDATVAAYAREIAGDEIAHVAFLRNALGASAVARPAINIDGSDTGAFTAAARAAGVVGATATFDPYASDDNFLLAAFLFEDVGVTAYRGAITSIRTKATIEAAAGIHAAEAYHAGLIRSVLYARGVNTAALLTATTNISNARDQLDGAGVDLDQPIVGTDTASNITPADTNGLIFVRSPAQVFNIVYLTPVSDPAKPTPFVTRGGFFPAGVNGTLNSTDPTIGTSAAA
jgi:hypothetical protein